MLGRGAKRRQRQFNVCSSNLGSLFLSPSHTIIASHHISSNFPDVQSKRAKEVSLRRGHMTQSRLGGRSPAISLHQRGLYQYYFDHHEYMHSAFVQYLYCTLISPSLFSITLVRLRLIHHLSTVAIGSMPIQPPMPLL